MNLDSLLKKNDFVVWLALKHHITHKKERINFIEYPYQKAIYFDKHRYIVIKKSTQCGITEYLLVRSLGKAILGWSIFYVLPSGELVNRFVRNRVDKSIRNSPYFRNLELIAKEFDEYNRSDSMKLKDIGEGTISYNGSFSSIGFSEFPADEFIIDELDECNRDNIIMAWERMSNSAHRYQVKVANPKVVNGAIDQEYSKSNQMSWRIKHTCKNWVEFDWFKQVVEEVDKNVFVIRDKDWEWGCRRDINIICQHCGKPINRKQDGLWVPKFESVDRHGYHINKLFSGKVPMVELLERFNDGLKDDKVMQRFHNADLGLAYTAPGSQLTIGMLDKCVGDHHSDTPYSGFGLAGIDVGRVLNVVIGYLTPGGQIKIGKICELPVDLKELIRVLVEYNVKIVAIDGLPERNFVTNLKNAYKNVYSFYYADSKKEPVDSYQNVTVDRTATLDSVKEGVLAGLYIFPANARSIDGFYPQLCASTRIFDQKRNKGNGAYIWVDAGPDHYFHALNYLGQAKRLLVAAMK